jgi:predicted dehydrogenase
LRSVAPIQWFSGAAEVIVACLFVTCTFVTVAQPHPTCGAAGRSGAQGKSSRDVRIGPDLSGPARLLLIPKPEPLRTEHENFRDAVLGKESDIVTMTQGATVVQVCEAMITSTSPSATPRKLAISSHTVATLALE